MCRKNNYLYQFCHFIGVSHSTKCPIWTIEYRMQINCSPMTLTNSVRVLPTFIPMQANRCWILSFICIASRQTLVQRYLTNIGIPCFEHWHTISSISEHKSKVELRDKFDCECNHFYRRNRLEFRCNPNFMK